MRWSSTVTVCAAGVSVFASSPAAQAASAVPGELDSPSVAESNIGCEGARGLFLAEYWAFLRSNPHCIPNLDDDEPIVSLLTGSDGDGCDKRGSAYGSRGRCNTVRPR